MRRERAFVEFEDGPLQEVLGAVGRSHGLVPETLPPDLRLTPSAALTAELEALGLRVDLRRLRTLRALVGAVVPLLEERPRAHH